MTPHNELRLLPWSGPDGKPCFLSTDDNDGYLSRLADNIESVQLVMGARLLDDVHEVLADRCADAEKLLPLVADLAEVLQDVIRVATSRGHRVTPPTRGIAEALRPAAPQG
ncbi:MULTISPECIES: hypothetical protein [unclassified Streptomyces]|uniref:hypothetical protein n=1 Tax=unclassified Streptomyces TaxID=2593676 RepID=UPI0036626EFF